MATFIITAVKTSDLKFFGYIEFTNCTDGALEIRKEKNFAH
jgi:hypothetical protein